MKTIYDPHFDMQFEHSYIDIDETRQRIGADGQELTFRFVHGGFEGTSVKYAFCFPSKESYRGRFFQHLSPFPGPDEELASLNKSGEEDMIAFAITHGACFVECNMGSTAVFGSSSDSTIFYRSNAAAAMQCRKIAQGIYGNHRIYGYVFGGSGGGYKTMSCVENTNQYDGAVPFVIGSPMSLPNCLTVMANGARQLRHCWQRIVDNVEVGGSGDPYKGLNEEESAALKELLSMGFPARMIFSFAFPTADGSLPVLTPGVKSMDPGYFEDFWTKPGYEGFENIGGVLRDLTDMTVNIVGVGIGASEKPMEIDDRNGTDTAWQKMLTDGGASYIEVTETPSSDYLVGIDIIIKTGAAQGKRLRLGSIDGKRATLGMTYGTDTAADVLALLHPGDEVTFTNRDYIAIQHYHRHQVPEDTSFHAWDQFRGSNLHQRPVISYGFTAGGCGSVQDGNIQGKVIVMNSMMDGDFPWQADWYFNKVHEVNGEKANDMIRIWYNDNCPHGDVAETGDNLRFTSYLGMLNQALLDVSAWVENGTQPAPSSVYQICDSQVQLAQGAQKRKGTQPVVDLTMGGEKLMRVKVGDEVEFQAQIDLTPWSGEVVGIDWSFEGEQTFSSGKEQASHRYDTPGTYFPTVHVTSSRCPQDPYLKLRNLDRVRVIVEA